jgi:hypothetical protein
MSSKVDLDKDSTARYCNKNLLFNMSNNEDLMLLCDSLLKEQSDASKNIDEMMSSIQNMRDELERSIRMQSEYKKMYEREQGELMRRTIDAERERDKAEAKITEYETKCTTLQKEANTAIRRRDIVIKMFEAHKRKEKEKNK